MNAQKSTATVRTPNRWDVFISHASEDKSSIARPLAIELRRRGLKVWYDEFELQVGDSLREKIDEGLTFSHHGIVILSPDFFEKDWSKKELAGLTATEEGRRNRILPIWHKITRQEVVAQSPMLADRKAATASDVVELADELISAMDREVVGADAPSEGLSLSPPPAQVKLALNVAGRSVVEQLSGRHEYSSDVGLISEGNLRKEVADWLSELRDLAEIWPELSVSERERAAHRASEIMLSMLEQEVLLQLGPYERRLTDAKGESTPWRGILIRPIPADRLIDEQRLRENAAPAEPDPADQALLDELLALVTRSAIKRVQAQDFHSSWPEKITTPFQFLAFDYDEVEYTFKDPELEVERQRLVQAANDFLHKEAMNGYPSRHVPHLRDTGYTPGEAEGLPERERLIAPRQRTIFEAAVTLVEVYDEFVRTAKRKGFNLKAMKAEVHPKVAKLDQRIEEIDAGA